MIAELQGIKAEHGIIILQPFANRIINGQKRNEYRNKPIPKHYLNIPLFLLSEGKILGIIRFIGCKITSFNGYSWKVRVLEKYQEPVKYQHKNGCQVWVRNVKQLQRALT